MLSSTKVAPRCTSAPTFLLLLAALVPNHGWAADDAVPGSHRRSAVGQLETTTLSSLGFTEIPISPLQSTADLVVADMNGDGHLDIVRGITGVLLGHGDGTVTSTETSFGGGTGFAVADLNGDGLLDIASATGFLGFAFVLHGNGDGTFQPTKKYRAGKTVLDIAAGDLNGDGVPEIVGTDSDADKAWVLVSNNGGGYKDRVRYDVGVSPRGIAIADMNEDGHPDLVTANASRTISILLGSGDTTFQPATTFAVGVPLGLPLRDLDVLDLDGDGHLDLVATALDFGNDGGGVVVMLGNGDGTVDAPTHYFPLGSPYADGSRETAIGDLNQDGTLDMAVSSPVLPTVFVLLGNGDGTFTLEGSVLVGSSCNAVAIADMNEDGWNDIVIDSAVLLNLGPPAEAARASRITLAPHQTEAATVSPNPLRGNARLSWTLAKDGPVSVTLFDLSGRRVRTLQSDRWTVAGRQELEIKRQGLPPGVYLYRIQSEVETQSGRLVVMN